MAKKKLTVKELEATRKGINKDEEDAKKAKAQGVRTSAPVYTYKDTNVTASDVAKKFNVQLPNKNASTGSTNAPGANAKAPATSAAYTNKVADMFEKSKLYAAQGPEYVLDLANSIISGAATKPDKGNLGALDIDSIHDMTKISSEVARMLTDAGIFNTREIATNPLYAHLAQQEYRKSLLPTLQGELTNSQKADEANKAAQAEYEAKLRGMNAEYSKQAEKAAEWKNFFSLLGENPTLEDKLRAAGIATGQTYDMGVFRGMDKYTAYEQKLALDNWFAGLDAAALSAAPVVEEPEAPKYNSKTAGIQDEIGTLEKYINAHQTLEELTAYARSNPDFATASVYNAPVYEEPSVLERMFVQEMGGAYADDALAAYINGQPMMPQFMRDPRSEDFYKRWEEQGYNYMLDQDKAIWNALRKMDPAKADAYLQALSQIYLLPTRAQGYRAWDETVATNPWTAAPAWLGSVGRGVLNTFDFPQQALEAGYGIDNPYSAAFDNLNRQGYTRGAHLGEIRESDMPDWLKKAAEVAYQGVSSFADNGARLLATGMNPTAALVMAGVQSASGSLRESAERDDMSGAAKIIKAIGTGAAEVGTEKIGLDALFDMGKAGAKKYLSVVLSELGEESLNAASEPVLEAVVAFLFDHEADIKSGPEFWEDMTDTALTTLVSASLMGGSAVASDYFDTRSYGKGIVNNGDVDAILGMAQSMPENSESKRIADEIAGKQGKGKKPSFYQFGQLTKAISKDLSEEHAAVINRVQDEAIAGRLQELGDDAETAKKNAPIIRKVYRGEKLTMDERAAVRWNDRADKVTKELIRENNYTGDQPVPIKWVKGMKETQASESADVIGKQLQVQVATVTPIGKAANRAEEAAKKRVPKRDGKPKLATDTHVTFRGTDGSAEVSGDIMRFEESDEGMQVVVQTGKGKEGEQKVKLEDWISADGDGVATILSYIGDEQLPHSVTAEEANTLMQVYKHSGGNAKAVIQAFDVNYLAGYSGADQIGSVLDPALSKIAYENGKRDAEKDEAQRKQRASEYKALENPVAGWIGKVDGREQVKGLGDAKALEEALQAMPESQRTAAEIMIETGKAVGLNVVLYDSDGKGAENDIQNGMFEGATNTVYFDASAWVGNTKQLQAMKKQGTLGYAMLRVGGHELTHYLEVAAPEAYAKYSKAVKDALKAKGVDFAVQMRERIDKANAQGRKLTMAGAAAEVIADASENMLQDSKLFNRLDTDTKSKIRAFLQNFAQKVKEIFQHLTGGHKESAALREMKNGVYHYLEGLQDLWDAGFDEILAKGTDDLAAGDTESMEGQEVKYSVRELEDGTQYVHVDTDQHLFDNVQESDYPRTARNYIRDHFRNTVIGTKVRAYVRRDSENEYTLPAKKNIDPDIYQSKMRAATELDNMLDVSSYIGHEDDDGRHPDAVRGWDKYRTVFEVDGRFFEGTVSLKLIQKGDLFYDVNNIKDITEPMRAKYSEELQYPGQSDVTNSVPQSAANVNPDVKNSDRDTDDQTETDAFKRWFGDSVVVNEDGTPKVLYHQTEDEFYVFDTRHKGAGTRDNETPFGIFMKTNNRDIGVKGSRQMALYARITNPLRVNNRAELVWKLTQLSPEYARLKVRANEIDAEYGAKTKEAQAALRDYLVKLRENEKTSGSEPKSRKDLYSDPDFMKVFNAEDEIVDEWTETAAANDLAAKEAITKALKNAGYDGIILKEDRGSWGRSTDAYIALDPAQVKSATDNVGTFDPENPDIRYSDRDLPDGVTIREYLGTMKPTSSMTETEKLLLKRYQDQLRTLEEKEKLVEEQEEIIRTAPLRNPDGSLNDEITKAKNRYKIYRDQANRAARALANAEKDEGFARLMATSRQVVNDYLLGAAGNVADAQDVLESEINELTRQLTKLEADVTRTSQGQRTAFARGLYNPDDLKAAAQKLKDTYGSRMSVQNIANRLALAYGELYANDGAEGGKMFMAASRDLATDLLAGNKFRYQSEILPMLREQIGTISLSDTDLQEIGNAGLTVTEYKRALSPYIKVSAEGSDLSSYASNAEYYGNGALAAVLGDENEGNLAMRLYDVISQEKAKEADNGYDGMSESQLIGMAMADIAGANLPMSANSSTVEYLRKELLKYAGENAEVAITVEEAISKAKKATAKAGRIWLEEAKNTETARQAVEYYRALDEKRRVMELAEQKKQITEQLKSDTAKKLQEKVTAQREEYREREKKAREYRKARVELDKVRKRISRNVKAINALRVRETDKKHVPQQLQYMADLMMQTFTDTNLGRLAFPQEKLHSLSRTYRLLLSEEVDATHYWDDEIEAELDNLVALSEAYNGLKNKKDGVPSVFTLEGVEYETEILRGVDNVVANILNMIDAWNDNFLRNRTGTFETFANQTGEKLRVHDDYKVKKGWRGKVQTMLDETIRTGNMTPVYFFDHLHNQELLDVFEEIREGMHKAAMIEREGKEYIEKVRANRNYGKWVADGRLKFETSKKDPKTGKGHTIELTREEACEIYAIAKREAANKLYQTEHLLYGGFQYKHRDQHVSDDGKYLVQDIPNQLDAADLEKIGNWLTAEQKAYADDLVGFLSTTMADYGNAASMEMYGYNKFTESYYIPFKTVAEQRYLRGDEGPQGENAGTGRLLNSGFTHKVQHKANATLYVGGISETVAEHIHKMAAYSAMVQPIENLKRLLNHKVLENDGTSNTIRALIGQKYGKAAENYMTQLLKDLNGATQSDQRASAWTDMMVSAFKRGAVMASASVVLQQPTAMARAMAMISPKYFTNNPFYRPGKGTWEEMLKHSGTAVIKDMGKFDVGMGKTASQYILDEDLNVAETYQRLKEEGKTKAGKAALDRFIDWLTAAPGVADQWTWGLIWKAVKAEQAALHPNMDQTSDEFLDMVGKRFDEVVDHTQVYDSVLTKSNLMRSQNGFHKMATSFMAEPTLSINMLYDALTGKHGKKQAARIIGSVAASQVLAGALAALVQAWNDDEDKRNWLEKYADRASSNIFSNINVFGMIPYISDIVSLFEGYDVERPDLSMIADLMDYTQKYFKAFADGGMPSWKDTENFVGTLANLAGVPAKNISREIRRTRNAVFNTNWNAPDAFNVGQVISENTIFNSGKNKEYYQRIVTADLRGDVELAENLREYMLTSKMVTPDKLRSEIKTALKEAYIDGDTDDDTAIDMLVEIGAYEDREDAYWEVDKWKYMQETGASADSYSKYNDFYTAVETGKDLKKTIQVYLDNGASKSSLAGKITSQYKPQMIALKESGKGYADLQARILTAYEALGYDRQEKLKDIQKWFKTEGKK